VPADPLGTCKVVESPKKATDSVKFGWVIRVADAAGKKYFRWMPGDCAGSEIIVWTIFQPWVGQVNYVQDEYSSDRIIFRHFRQLKN
jgi:hypothetical protein